MDEIVSYLHEVDHIYAKLNIAMTYVDRSTRRLNSSIHNPLLCSLLSRPNPFGSWGARRTLHGLPQSARRKR